MQKLIPVLLLCLLAGCIASDETCTVDQPHISLVFSYDYHTGTGDRFAEQVHSVDIFIYDGQGRPVGDHTVPVSAMEGGNTVRFQLDPGSYTFVAWANFDGNHFIYNHGNTLEESSLSVNAAADGSVEIHSATLFHGTAKADFDGKDVTVPVPLIKNTNLVDIYIVGKEAPGLRSDAQTGLSVRITGSNGRYDFGNRPLACEPLKYTPAYERINEEVLCARMTVLRMFTGDDLRLTISDPANPYKPTVYSGNLTEIIFSKIGAITTDKDLDRHDTYQLTFLLERYLDGTWALAGIYSGDWTNIDTEEGV
ncbi:MAG: FimB/Mfa2 family fimbrial subunit [Rikenellaceae bacterium]|nr:FimB/Mfa2 family fimbrial subunit [Rikenellaceae bacterium]